VLDKPLHNAHKQKERPLLSIVAPICPTTNRSPNQSAAAVDSDRCDIRSEKQHTFARNISTSNIAKSQTAVAVRPRATKSSDEQNFFSEGTNKKFLHALTFPEGRFSVFFVRNCCKCANSCRTSLLYLQISIVFSQKNITT
jgi:hypothetical protein